jgi:hypothetical protein
MTHISVQPLLAATHGLIIKLTTLLLKLIITNVKSVASEAVVTHSDLVLLAIQVINHLIIVLVIVVNASSIDVGRDLNVIVIVSLLADVQAVVSLVVPIAIGCVILISV